MMTIYICTQSHIEIKIKILHILHWHLGPSHVIIKLLKDKISAVLSIMLPDYAFFVPVIKCFHILH